MSEKVLAILDRLSDLLGRLSAWLFFLTGALITYDVVARYFFNAPTIWASEISQLLLIWGTYLGMSALLRRRQHIRITMLLALLGPRALAFAEGVALLFITAFSLAVSWYGWGIAFDSFERGRTAGTLLNLPNWWSEAAVPLAFLLLAMQALAEIVKLVLGQGPTHLEAHESGEQL